MIQSENLIVDNGIYNYDAIDFLCALYEDYGDESIDMFLCDFPYTFKGNMTTKEGIKMGASIMLFITVLMVGAVFMAGGV